MIRSAIVDGVVTLTLDRGGASNAFALRHWDELADHARRIAASSAHVVIIESAHPASFSAGADLAEMAAQIGAAGFGTALRTRMGNAIEAVAALPMPVIAAIDGACFGAAVALVLACDIRIAGAAARFSTPPAKLGISYPARDVARLSAQVGQGQAARLLLTGAVIDADEAARIGLAEIRVSNAGTEARHLAGTIAANDADAVRALKAVLAAPERADHDATFDALFAGAAFADRLTAIRGGPR